MKLPKPVTTETDVAEFLLRTPGFFERQAPLLATVRLFSGYGSRAVCLQERQASLLRGQIKALESRVADMLGHAQTNAAIASKLQAWTLKLLQTQDNRDLPEAIVQGLMAGFDIPQVALKVWGLGGDFSRETFADGVSAEARAFAESLERPYCGANSGFEAVNWLAEPTLAASVALIPLRAGAGAGAGVGAGTGTGVEAEAGAAIDTKADTQASASVGAPVLGLLVLASPDAERFHSDMGTEFLERLGELAGTALSRLQAQPGQPQA
jgi:uncharacterized protein YigA (DUF484 family)